MTRILEDKLKSEFPLLLVKMHGSARETCMAYGVECDDGWYELIRSLCREVQDWSDRTEKQIVAEQIKEKFGGLRFYISSNKTNPISDGEWSVLNGIINRYEEMALNTCEITGAKGTLSKRGHVFKTVAIGTKGFLTVNSKN